MPYRMRRFTCPDCGMPVVRRANKRDVVRCLPHALAWSAEVQRQLAAHSGPMYDRWAIANLAAAQRMLASAAPAEWPVAILGDYHGPPPGRTLPGGGPFLTCVFKAMV